MLETLIKITKSTGFAIKDTIYHDGIEHAGYLSFLFMLSIFPFLVFFVALTGFVGNEYIVNTLIDIILKSDWAKFIDALKPRILEITEGPPEGLLTIAIVSAMWTASSIFEAIRTILNRAYRVNSPPSYLLRRLISIFEFLAAIFIFIFFVLVMIILPSIAHFIDSIIPLNQILLHFFSPESVELRYFLLFSFVFFVVAFSYTSLPNKKIKFKSVVPGTLVVILSWSIFSNLFKLYITNFPQVNLIYGSIAGVIVALMYFYACSIIYIFGAEFNYQLSTNFSFLRNK